MISIYREGAIPELGLNVGWVNGLVIYWCWISFRKETKTSWRLRIRARPFGFLTSRTDIVNYKRAIIDEYLFDRSLVMVTREFYEDIKSGRCSTDC